jgi:hypothetical protein
MHRAPVAYLGYETVRNDADEDPPIGALVFESNICIPFWEASVRNISAGGALDLTFCLISERHAGSECQIFRTREPFTRLSQRRCRRPRLAFDRS